ncbi:MAG: CPBP family intramembrane glutamic endopeptidase [Verrucomicrobiota bacterium]
MLDKLIEYLAPALIAGFLFKLWFDDYRARGSENAPAKPIPGASPTNMKAIWIGVVGALLILALETGGEIVLGISDEQKSITFFFLLPILAAAITEEVIFRGFLLVTNRGRAALVASIFGFSLIFAILHDFLWTLEMPEDVAGWKIWEGSFVLNLDIKGFFSTFLVLLNSLWFYFIRIMPANKEQSLIPCFVAHGVSNLGVFLIKWAQGFVVGIF